MYRVVAVTLAAGVMGLLCSASVKAEIADDQWRYVVEAYLWAANVDIEAASGSNTEIRFTDIIEDFELGGMALFAAQRGRWLVGADVIYLDIDDSVDEPVEDGVELNDLGVEAWVASPNVGYRLMESEQHTLHAILGARYVWIDISAKVDLSAPNPPGTEDSSVSEGSWDATIGLRGQRRFMEKWYVTYHFDVGTGGSDFTWQGLGAMGYRFNRFDAVAGYRYLDWHDTENDALNDLSLSGFFAGVKFFF